jgi:hypothetical protein
MRIRAHPLEVWGKAIKALLLKEDKNTQHKTSLGT